MYNNMYEEIDKRSRKMQINVHGHAEKGFSPDQIMASVTFNYHASTYDEALKGGVEKVKNYIDSIAETTDFKPEVFKTRAYSIQELFHMNRLEPRTETDLDKDLQKHVSDGFFFTQFVYLEFDYDKVRLAKLLAASSKIPNAPVLHIDFMLKDVESKKRELISVAYDDAKKEAEALAVAANKNLRDCVHVDIVYVPHDLEMKSDTLLEKAKIFNDASMGNYEQQLKSIDETFKPDDITLSKDIGCVWETSD